MRSIMLVAGSGRRTAAGFFKRLRAPDTLCELANFSGPTMTVSASGAMPIDLQRHFANSGIERERRRVRAASVLVILFIAAAIIGVVWLRWG
jgi:predicted nucleic acid-binding Zn ribbon protein